MSNFKNCQQLLSLAATLVICCIATEATYAQQLTPLKPTKPQAKPPAGIPETPQWGDVWNNQGGQQKGGLDTDSFFNGQAQTPITATGVPKTPAEIEDYLRKMRRIIDSYDNTVAGLLMGGGGQITTDQSSISSAAGQTKSLVAQINATTPPRELTDTHAGLATTLNSVSSFLSRGGDASAMMQAFSLMGQVHSTLENYHSGVLRVMAANNISRTLDPFAGENQDLISKFAGGMQNFQNQKMGELMGGGGNGGAGGGNGGGDMGSMMGQLGGMLGGGGLGGLFGGGGGNGGSSGFSDY